MWPRTTIYGLTYSGKDGEEIMPCSMPLLVQNHGKMCIRFKIVVIELDCKLLALVNMINFLQIHRLHPSFSPFSFPYARCTTAFLPSTFSLAHMHWKVTLDVTVFALPVMTIELQK
jgi:hypothetical protein